MAPGDRWRQSRSQLPVDSSEVEAPSPISMASSAQVSEGPALASPNEPTTTELGPNEAGPNEAVGPSEVGLSEYIIIFLK